MNFAAIRNLSEYLSVYMNVSCTSWGDSSENLPAGFEYVGGGSFRAVYTHKDFPGVVFKVRRWENDCNEDEFNFFFDTTDEIRSILAQPIYLSRDGRVIAQVRCDEIGIDPEELDPLFSIMPANRHWDMWASKNVGKINGRIAIFDYSVR